MKAHLYSSGTMWVAKWRPSPDCGPVVPCLEVVRGFGSTPHAAWLRLDKLTTQALVQLHEREWSQRYTKHRLQNPPSTPKPVWLVT